MGLVVMVGGALGAGGEHEPPVLHALGREDAVGRALQQGRGAAQHDDLHAVVVVEVHVHTLRRKLGADFIRNVRGVGYRVAPAAP